MNFFKKNIKLCSKKLVSYFGGVLLSRKIYHQVLMQRNSMFAELVNADYLLLNAGMTAVVFSKDRPIQLHSFLISYFKYVKNPIPLTVICNASSTSLKLAYEEVFELFNNQKISFVFELGSFKKTFNQFINTTNSKSLMFFVDDIIFLQAFDFNEIVKIDPNEYVLSLRLSPNLTKSYTEKVAQSPPKLSASNISNKMLVFNWFENGCEWSDPWSMDGHLFPTSEIRVIANHSDFSGPNTLEIALKAFNGAIGGRKGLCFKESKILNLPINRVQTEVLNSSGNVSVDFLLKKWNEGYCLDISKFDSYIPKSPHEEHLVTFRKRV